MDHRDVARTEAARSSMGLPRSILLAAVVGGAFGLGLAAGDSRATAMPADTKKDPIAAADANTERYERLVKASTSTWHRELTTPEPPTTLAAIPGMKGAATTATSLTSPPSFSPPEVPSAAPVVATEVVQAVRESHQPAVVAAVEVEPQPHAANDDRADQIGDADRAAAPDPRRLAQVIDHVVNAGPKKEPTSAEPTRFALQLASTGTAAGAKAIAEGFSARGFAPTVTSAEVPGRGTVYRVRIAGLVGRAAAEAMKARVGQGLVVTE
jgi:hypothetical protein